MTTASLLRFAGCILAVVLLAVPVASQTLPTLPPGLTPEQAAAYLRGNPQAGDLVRQRLMQSGLARDEIQYQLAQAGYPQSLLDQYLVSGGGFSPTAPTATMLEALDLLGVRVYQLEGETSGDSVAAELGQDSLRYNAILYWERERARAGLRLFGLEAFRQPTTQFRQLVTGPMDDDYMLGPGDVMVLLLTGAVELAQPMEVTRDGFVVIPQVGQVFAANLTLGQFKDALYPRMRQAYQTVGREPDARTHMTVSVARVRQQFVRVIGEVAFPGSYPVTASGGVLAALYAAGGPTQAGNFRSVQVRRGSELVTTVDLYEFLLTGTTGGQVRLAAGDVVFVGTAGPRVKVTGAVRRPGVYELKPGETVRDAVRYAGGLEATAGTETATVDHILPPAERAERGLVRTVRTVPLGAVLSGEVPAPAMGDGDSLTVFYASGGRRLGVSVSGSVWQAGTYELTEGMTLWDALQAAGGVRPESYRGRVQVLRSLPDSTRRMIGVRLPADGTEAPAENPRVVEGDSIVVYARTAFRPARWIAVGGAVQAPDTFAFADSMTLRDAVMLAGGTTDGAALTTATVSRVRLGDAGGVAEAIEVPLDSTFVFDPTAYLARPAGRNAASFYLHPYDVVTIRTQEGWVPPMRVVVTGQVADPGSYLLLHPTERLSALLARAGGLGPRALPGGIALFRRGGGSDRHRIGVDIARALDRPGRDEDIPLLQGDSIHIPAYDATVRVDGAVNAPTVVRLRPGAGLDYYVSAAGGWAQEANRGESYVVLANGIVERGGTPGPGSMVVVPAKNLQLERPSIWPQILSGIASIAAALTTIVVVLVR